MDDLKDNLKTKSIIPVILSGGTGSRLWPLSRECYPKQYLNLERNNPNSLLQNTFLRLKGIKNLDSPIIICNEQQRFIVAEQMREINVKPTSIILEPIGKNTAPAIALASIFAQNRGGDPLLLILSADHIIKDSKNFQNIIKEAIPHANNKKLITFGVAPKFPETGFGYIESFEELSKEAIFSDIKRFIEKPEKEIAKKLIKDKHFSWNSGIFLFQASTILHELEKFQPELVNLCRESINQSKKDLDFVRIGKDSFQKCSNLPIDVAVMERTKLGRVFALDVGWSDIGNWKSVWEDSHKDQQGNSVEGKTIVKNSRNCYFRGEDRLVVGLGLDNIVVIETNDAVLVANKNETQTVKDIVKELDEGSLMEGKVNKKMYRPWGSYTSIIDGDRWQVKRLEIKPGGSLSLQMHHHRAEHWVVVNGTAKVEIDSEIKLLSENESIYVPLGSKHRLSNPGKIKLVLIEVQSGSYLGENDIQRFEDNYGRNNF